MTLSLVLLSPPQHHDERGWFSETYNADVFARVGITASFVQDNQSLSHYPGTVRGLHFQAPPYAQAKLVRVIRGRVIDVAVDIRAGSPTFGKSISVELSAENRRQLYIPAGFAHGFVTLEADTEIFYKVSAYYNRESEGGLRWDDPDLAIDWGTPHTPHLSAKDRMLQSLSSFQSPFVWDGRPMELLDITA